MVASREIEANPERGQVDKIDNACTLDEVSDKIDGDSVDEVDEVDDEGAKSQTLRLKLKESP